MTCRRPDCGHLDVNHSDLDLDHLGSCYQCDCIEFIYPEDDQ